MKNSFKGFTLVEVLIVIIIVGILIAALLPRLTGVQATARDTARAADTRNIATAAQLYYAENNDWPDVTDGCLDGSNALVDSGYMTSMPTDPQSNNQIDGCDPGEYFAVISGATFAVFAQVESENNGNVASTGDVTTAEVPAGPFYRSAVQ